jgi:alkanesulfonate monooxygenase SsuD/methylene tetrahydromethanopterin reductase-like flavin-dependent oxidoreductase (luciferase family)
VRVGYLIELNKGRVAQPVPTPDDAQSTLEAFLEEGVAAERSGFHSITVPHRHGRTETYAPGPFQLLTLLANSTTRAALGAFSYVATLIHPLLAAEQFAVIDNLSRGRLFTAVSRGYVGSYWEQLGVPQDRLLGRFLEALSIWRLAFTEERFTFDGTHWQVSNGILTPGPYQRGGWPIWGGSNQSPRAIRRCADYAVAVTADPSPLVPSLWNDRLSQYRARAEELGKQPFVVLMRNAWVDRTFERAVRTFGTFVASEWRAQLGAGTFSHSHVFPSVDAITPETCAPHLVIGTPAQCIEQLERLHEEYGVDYVIVRLRLTAGPSLREVSDQIGLFGEEVVAPIHRKYRPPLHPAIPASCRW